MAVLVVASPGLVGNQRFGATCWRHLQGQILGDVLLTNNTKVSSQQFVITSVDWLTRRLFSTGCFLKWLQQTLWNLQKQLILNSKHPTAQHHEYQPCQFNTILSHFYPLLWNHNKIPSSVLMSSIHLIVSSKWPFSTNFTHQNSTTSILHLCRNCYTGSPNSNLRYTRWSASIMMSRGMLQPKLLADFILLRFKYYHDYFIFRCCCFASFPS